MAESKAERESLTATNIQIRAVHDLEGLDRCVQLQQDIWNYSAAELIPRRVFLVANSIGGEVLGAYDGETMIGFTLGFPGYRNGHAYFHSHMLAVLAEYRNLGVGRRLKLTQRESAIRRGIALMEWTFDPLEIKNSYLNITRLGAICRRYEENFYGPSTSPLQGGLPTDRLYAEWWLNSKRVVRALQGEDVKPESSQRLAVPAEIYAWKASADRRGEARQTQTYNREALKKAFAEGLAVIGYERTVAGDGIFQIGYWDEDFKY